MRIFNFRCRIFTILFLVILPASAAKVNWEIKEYRNHKYVPLSQVKDFYNLSSMTKSGSYIILKLSDVELKFRAGGQEVLMNNVKFIFSHAVISLGSYHISIMDLKKVIDPVLRPFKIKAAKGFDTVIIDPGHGGKDPGAEAGEYRESNLMLELAAAVKESLMRNTDFKVILTRNEDVFLSLEDRITIATQSGADLFISLHADAVIEGEASGTTVYLLSENATDKMSAQLASRHNPSEILRGVDLSGLDSQVASVLIDMARQETKPRNEAFAQFILEVFKEKITELSSQPLRYAAFSVLKSPDIPSVLIEAGFMSTSSNLQNLITPIWRMEFADALSEAILRWQIKDAQKKFLKLE